ncbi:hypothetical protein QQ054_10105 [Oscillatoria amoena NRMC-F 0135]|nr:hypothetical protein [Oscillatoria amoena NRMC-F 0135]
MMVIWKCGMVNFGMPCLLFNYLCKKGGSMRLPAFVLLIFSALPICGQAQSIAGTWQVMKESNCLGSELETPKETEEELTNRMASLSGQTLKVITFNPDQSGEQNWKSVGKKEIRNQGEVSI